MDTIYIERDILKLPRTKAILDRYPLARQIEIDRYSDVFNAPGQNFRVQKSNPALILANKHGNRVIATPPGYHIGGQNNYYFSHMLNCIYDCRYCYLQGMYRSANYVLFVNYDDFFEDIRAKTDSHQEPSWFFSGYDCDSLALEPMTKFMADCLDALYSLSPEPIVSQEEHKTPSLDKRLTALKTLQQDGWKIGLRFDPLLKTDNAEQLYNHFFEQVFSELDQSAIHSVSLGPFRLPKPFFKKMIRLYPESKLLAANMNVRENMISYDEKTETDLLNYCETQLQEYITPEQYFPCVSVT